MQRTSPETERLKAWRKTKSAVQAYAMQPSAANADMVKSAFRKARRLTPRTASPLGTRPPLAASGIASVG